MRSRATAHRPSPISTNDAGSGAGGASSTESKRTSTGGAPPALPKKTVTSQAVYRKATVPAPAAPVQIVKAGYVVEVIKGGKRSEETFQ